MLVVARLDLPSRRQSRLSARMVRESTDDPSRTLVIPGRRRCSRLAWAGLPRSPAAQRDGQNQCAGVASHRSMVAMRRADWLRNDYVIKQR